MLLEASNYIYACDLESVGLATPEGADAAHPYAFKAGTHELDYKRPLCVFYLPEDKRDFFECGMPM